jgi:hypothetical protein
MSGPSPIPSQNSSLKWLSFVGQGESAIEFKSMVPLKLSEDGKNIESLYHYQEFDSGRLSDLLKNRMIHCSSPGKINDPWDCMPLFDDRPLYDPAGFRRYMDWFYSQPSEGQLSDRQKHMLETQLQSSPAELRTFLDTFARNVQDTIRARRIYCLTGNPRSTLMWSHYADHHHGICLEYGVDNPLFGMAYKVNYDEKYPSWIPNELFSDRSMETMLTKAKSWDYEDEYRLISLMPGGPPSPLTLIGEGFALPDGALKSVIVGCEGNVEAVRKVIDEHAPGLEVKRALRGRYSYGLVIEGKSGAV